MADMNNKNIVLFVDDELGVLNALERALFGEDYRCVFASSGMEALEIMEKEAISVIVTDMRMPGMDGLKLLKTVKEKYPDVIKIVLSGYAQISQVLSTINQVDTFKFILKPWDTEVELKPILQQAIEYYNFQQESKKTKDALEKRNIVYQGSFKKVEEKLKQHKNDFNNNKILYETVMKKTREIIKEYKGKEDYVFDQMLREIDDIQKLYYSYLETLPSEYDTFSAKKLIEGLISQIEKNHLNSVINIGDEKDKPRDIKCYGNYKMVHGVLSYLINFIGKKGLANKSNLIIATRDDYLHFLVSVALTDEGITVGETGKAYTKYKFQKDIDMLQEICKANNLKIYITEEEQKIVIKIQISVQA